MRFSNVAITVCLACALGVMCFTGVATADEIVDFILTGVGDPEPLNLNRDAAVDAADVVTRVNVE